MKLLLVRHLWGVDLSEGFAPYAAHWREIGYRAIEGSIRLVPDATRFRRTVRELQWDWVAQVMTRRGEPGGSVRQHLASLREQVEESLDLNPIFFNCHSGSDAWTQAEAEDFFGAALDLEREIGIDLSHETHRSRYFFNPWNTAGLLRKYPELKVTCDLSHWVCVAERLLLDCGEILNLCADHCRHIHARVGYEEGPQVPDPRAPEWRGHLETHEAWWEKIWRSQQRRGLAVSTLTPEFGPPPYLHTVPYTQEPVANLNDICDWMAGRERERFLESTGDSGRTLKA